MCTKFGVDSSSGFPVRARTNRQTRLNALPTPSAMPTWITNKQTNKQTQKRRRKPLCTRLLWVWVSGGRIFTDGQFNVTSTSGALHVAAVLPLLPLLIFCCTKRCSNDSLLFNGPPTTPKLPLPVGGISTPSNTWFLGRGSLGLRDSVPKWHLDEFGHFRRVPERDQQTQRQTDRQTDRQTTAIRLSQ